MIKEFLQTIFQEFNIKSPQPYYHNARLGTVFLDKLFATVCLGAAWGMFFKICRSERKFLGSEDPKYLYMRNRRIKMTDTLHALLSDPEIDINHLSNDFFKYGFAPYAYIDRDDYRLGESEWSYRDVKNTYIPINMPNLRIFSNFNS